MKLAICNDWHDKKSAVFWNADGFLEMLRVLRDRDKWETTFFKTHDRTFEWDHDCVKLSFSRDPKQQVLDYKPDAVLFFSDFSRPILKEFAGIRIPKALCYTGGLFDHYAKVPDIVFTESKVYMPWMRDKGVKKVVQAFGTNTRIFRPIKQPKIFDAVMTSTFASWKRHSLFAEALEGRPAVASGWWQESEPQCWQECQKRGVALLHHQMPESVNLLYNMSHTTVLTADTHGGSQRSVLESMAAGVPVIAMSDSDKTTEYVRESGFGAVVEPRAEAIRDAIDSFKRTPIDPQIGIDYIKSKWTEYHYADVVRDGILSIV